MLPETGLAGPWLRWLVGSLSPLSPRFKPSLVLEGFVVDKMVLSWISLQVLLVSPVIVFPPMLHAHSFPPH